MASGLNKTDWCRQNVISEKRFFYWQKSLRIKAIEIASSSVDRNTDIVKAALPSTATSFVELKFQDTPVSTTAFHPDAVIQSNGIMTGFPIQLLRN